MLKTGPVWSLGTMSGTSLDGVDAAMVLTDGDRIIEFGPSAYRAYTPAEQKTLAAAFGKWPEEPGVSDAAEVIETAHAEILSRFDGAKLIGFHGQTLAHDPAAGRTHQCGNGALLAEALGLPVVWDFRSGDVAMGGQGAPLVPFFHFACARFIGATSALAILNLGGVGNITWIDPSKSIPEEQGALLAFDTGPANAPINDLMQVLTGQGVDLNGAFAASGHVHEPLIDAFLALSYFHKIPPKSLDRNEFAQYLAAVCALPAHDAVATLTALAAACVAKGCEHFAQPISRLLVAGGGRHNASLMKALDERLPLVTVAPVSSVGLDGDMLEAQAFAYLAVRVMQGKPTSCPSTTGVAAAVGGGKISRPARV